MLVHFHTGPLHMVFPLLGTLSKIADLNYSLQECELEVGRVSCSAHCYVLVLTPVFRSFLWDVLIVYQPDGSLKHSFCGSCPQPTIYQQSLD